jgi:adenylyltransferase/sulfurtransferase
VAVAQSGCLGAVEVIKVLAGFGEPLLGQMRTCDLRNKLFRKVALQTNPNCPGCGITVGPAAR